jgi:signal peptidase I
MPEVTPLPPATEETAPPGDQPAEPPPQRARMRKGLPRWANLLVVGLFVAFLLYLHMYVIQVAYVPSDSMAPTLLPGDRLLVDLRAYRGKPPQRGDIVVFRSPTSSGYEVKRIIAVAGDRVVVGRGLVFVNGERLSEPYVRWQMLPEFPVGWALEPDEVFVMGDNRNRSEDSRDWGPLGMDRVVGRVIYRILPPRRIGKPR